MPLSLIVESMGAQVEISSEAGGTAKIMIATNTATTNAATPFRRSTTKTRNTPSSAITSMTRPTA